MGVTFYRTLHPTISSNPVNKPRWLHPPSRIPWTHYAQIISPNRLTARLTSVFSAPPQALYARRRHLKYILGPNILRAGPRLEVHRH